MLYNFTTCTELSSWEDKEHSLASRVLIRFFETVAIGLLVAAKQRLCNFTKYIACGSMTHTDLL